MVTAFILLDSPTELSCSGGGKHQLSSVTVPWLVLSEKTEFAFSTPCASLLPGNL